jgi:Spy/CpxP family protein refolding chaperone
MTHKTLTTAIALALTVAATAGAQSTDRGQRAERPRGAQQQDSVGRRGRGGPEGMLLRGITLSADQKAKLADLRAQERAQFDANRPRRQDGANGQTDAARPRRERGDTTGMAARRAEFAKRFEQRIAAVRNILTADQRVQFDKNVAELKAQREQNGGRFGQHGGFRGRTGK